MSTGAWATPFWQGLPSSFSETAWRMAGSLTTTKLQHCRLAQEGARRAASSTACSFSSSTGLSSNLRMLRRSSNNFMTTCGSPFPTTIMMNPVT